MSLDIDLYCDHCRSILHSQNITHNLARMAKEAEIYQVLWEAEENGIEYASQLVQPLVDGIAVMKQDPNRFRQYDAANGWGRYDNFVPWLDELLAACREHAKARVRTSC